MLQKIRVKAQTAGAKVLAAIICFVLVVFGFGAFNLFTVNEPAAAVVNGEDITEARLVLATNVERLQVAQRYGEDADPELIDSLVRESEVLDQLIENYLYRQKAVDLGMASSREKYLSDLLSNEIFQDDGVFSEGRFTSIIGSMGYTPESWEREIRNDNLVEQLWNLQKDTSFTTTRELRDEATVERQTRNIAYLLFEATSYVPLIEPTEEEIGSYYDENPDEFMTDEEYEFEYVVLSKADFTDQFEITGEDVKLAFEEEREQARIDAERKAQHILLRVDDSRTEEEALEQAADIRRQYMEGELFDTLAVEYSEDESNNLLGGDLGFAGRGIYVPTFEDALFGLEIEEVSEPVVTQFGVHLIKLNEIAEVDETALEEKFEEIRQGILEEKATPMYEEQLREFETLTFESDYATSLDAVAETFGLNIQTQGGVTPFSGDGLLSSSDVRAQLFVPDVLENGFNSVPITVDERQTLVGRLVSTTAPELKPLEAVSTLIAAKLRREESARRAQADRDAARERIDETEENFTAVALEFGLQWKTVDGMEQFDPDVPRAIREAAFSVRTLPEGEREILVADGLSRDRSIVVVSAVIPGMWNELPETEQTSLETSLEIQNESREIKSFVKALRDTAKIRINIPSDS